jgi:RNA polymerase sigma factor (sigma-70 family)
MPPPTSEQARWFSEEVHAHDQSLKRYLRRSFPTVRDVEDLVQESYLRVWQRQLIRPISAVSNSVTASVKGFLFQVARRLAIDTIRRNRASPIEEVTNYPPLFVIDQGAVPHEAACTQQEFEWLLEAIDTLPARCRAVLVLRKIRGLSPADTARELGIAEETVHVHARRGLQRVQATLRRRGVIRGCST